MLRGARLVPLLFLLGACRGAAEAPLAKAPTAAAPRAEAPLEAPRDPSPEPASAAPAPEVLAKEILILDGHIDLPWRLDQSRGSDGKLTEDIAQRTPKGDFDIPRARAGGLDAPFMSIYVPARFEGKGACAVADRLIDLVEELVARYPSDLALARSPAEVRRNFAAGKISLPLGMENGAPIEGDLANLQHFYDRGVRYITLTHGKDNHLADSSYDTRHTHGGLSPFGEQVVARMNALGIMVDVSHLSDEAFWDVLEVTRAPVIASHSSCRHFTPGFERNLSDEMIRALAANGGVIQVNFGSSFLDDEVRRRRDAQHAQLEQTLAAAGLRREDPRAKARIEAFEAAHRGPYARAEQVADHIDHVVRLVGIDHVGFGSDFDGVGDSLPRGLEDVSQYPRLLAILLERGYTLDEVRKIAGENVLRVWQAVEDRARAAAP